MASEYSYGSRQIPISFAHLGQASFSRQRFSLHFTSVHNLLLMWRRYGGGRAVLTGIAVGLVRSWDTAKEVGERLEIGYR